MKIKVTNARSMGDDPENRLSVLETKKTTLLLENESQFEQEVNEIRTKYNIDQDWLSEDKTNFERAMMYDQKWSNEKTDDYFNECREITTRLYLPNNWWLSISWFISFNVFPVPDTTYLEVGSKHDSQETDVHSPYSWRLPQILHYFEEGYVFIVIPEKISKNKLYKLIDKQWDQISERMNFLNDVPQSNILRPELAKEITMLRDVEKLTFSEISRQLSDKYLENDEIYSFVCSEDYIKNLYHRWKKSQNKLVMCPF